MTAPNKKKSAKKKSDSGSGSGISMTNMMFQIITKNTEVITELCKNLEGSDETLKEVSKGYIAEVAHRELVEKEQKKQTKLLIAILIGVILTSMLLIDGGEASSWLLKVLAKIVL